MAEQSTDHVAMTQADGAVHDDHQQETLLGLGAEGWVYVGLTIFILLAIFVGKAPKRITEALDERIAETTRELNEAKTLRAEAQALLADAKAKQAQGEKDAAAIIAQAKVEAEDMLKAMEANAGDLITRRQKMAEDKIAAAERAAIAELRSRAATAATAAAAALIVQNHAAAADQGLVNDTISKLAH